MKTIVSTFLIVFLGLLNSSAQDLEEFLMEAANKNFALKSAYIDFEIELQKVAKAKDLPDPTLNFGYFIQPVETRLGPQLAKFSLKQQIPWFGTLAKEENLLIHNAEVKFEIFNTKKIKLFLMIKKAYYPMLEIRDQMILLKDYIRVLEEDKQLATSFYENGKASQVDILFVDSKLIETRARFNRLKDELHILKIEFNALLNRDLYQGINLLDSLDINTDKIEFNSLDNHPVIKTFNEHILASEAEIQYAKKTGKPSLMFGVDYTVTGELNQSLDPDNGRDAILPTVQLSIPLFSKKVKADIKIAELKKSQYIILKEDELDKLKAEWALELIHLNSDRRDLMTYDQQILYNQRMIKLLYIEYQNSKLDFDRILKQKQHVLDLQKARLKVIKNLKITEAKLEYLQYS